MAEHETPKGRYMYVLGTEHAVRFLSGGRSMSSVLSRNEALRKKFTEKFGDRCQHDIVPYWVASRSCRK